VDWIRFVQDWVQYRSFVNCNDFSRYVNDGEFPDQLSGYQLLRKDSALWS
jgi:hypothetical protein